MKNERSAKYEHRIITCGTKCRCRCSACTDGECDSCSILACKDSNCVHYEQTDRCQQAITHGLARMRKQIAARDDRHREDRILDLQLDAMRRKVYQGGGRRVFRARALALYAYNRAFGA